MNKLVMLGVGVALLTAGAIGARLFAADEVEQQPQIALGNRAAAQLHPKQARAMRDAAMTTYQTTQTDYDRGETTFTEVYRWSRRWAEAELSVAKARPAEIAELQEHWKRMKRFYLRIKALNKTGRRGGEKQKLDAAGFYVAEAELWIAAFGGEAPAKLGD
jgi:hypothetical protein